MQYDTCTTLCTHSVIDSKVGKIIGKSRQVSVEFLPRSLRNSGKTFPGCVPVWLSPKNMKRVCQIFPGGVSSALTLWVWFPHLNAHGFYTLVGVAPIP